MTKKRMQLLSWMLLLSRTITAFKSPFTITRSGLHRSSITPPTSVRQQITILDDHDPSPEEEDYSDWLFENRSKRVVFYGSLAFLETLFWYYLAPGIDPESRWFNPVDGDLIASLLTPSIALSPPVGSGLGFSSLLLNSFLILPLVWALLLLQEESGPNGGVTKIIITGLACTTGFFVGGGALIPYMMLRRPLPFHHLIDPTNFPAPLAFFEKSPPNSPGPILLLMLTLIVIGTFLIPISNLSCSFDKSCYYYDWIVEWNAFVARAQSSQFTALALFDSTMISIMVLDPMMDDALRRGFVDFNDDWSQWKRESREDSIRKLLPFVAIPLIGPVAWICLRPRYKLMGQPPQS